MANEGIVIIGTLWSTFIFLALLVYIAANAYFTLRNAYVQELIWGGWVPLMLALAVSRWASPRLRRNEADPTNEVAQDWCCKHMSTSSAAMVCWSRS